MGIPGIAATLLSLLMMVVSVRRQRFIVCDTELVSIATVAVKRLICVVLFLNALALAVHSVVTAL